MGFRAAASATMALAALVAAQTSPPTVVTTRILRGPDWSRLRSAIPDIIVGRNQRDRGQEPVSWNAAPLAGFAPATMLETLNRHQSLFVRSVEAASTQVIPKPSTTTSRQTKSLWRPSNWAASASSRTTPIRRRPCRTPQGVRVRARLKAAALGLSPPLQSLPVLETVTNESRVNVADENRSRSEAPCSPIRKASWPRCSGAASGSAPARTPPTGSRPG